MCVVSGVRCQVSGVRCQVCAVSNLRPQASGRRSQCEAHFIWHCTYFAALNIIFESIFIVTLTCTRKLNHRFAFAGSAIR